MDSGLFIRGYVFNKHSLSLSTTHYYSQPVEKLYVLQDLVSDQLVNV